jgi:hypothetical protein
MYYILLEKYMNIININICSRIKNDKKKKINKNSFIHVIFHIIVSMSTWVKKQT